MLTVNSDEFWEGVSPVDFGALPSLQDAVTVVGYPIGGDTISVTSGVVSRIEVTSYVHGATELLGVQVSWMNQMVRFQYVFLSCLRFPAVHHEIHWSKCDKIKHVIHLSSTEFFLLDLMPYLFVDMCNVLYWELTRPLLIVYLILMLDKCNLIIYSNKKLGIFLFFIFKFHLKQRSHCICMYVFS
mgnify:FL=1